MPMPRMADGEWMKWNLFHSGGFQVVGAMIRPSSNGDNGTFMDFGWEIIFGATQCSGVSRVEAVPTHAVGQELCLPKVELHAC